MINLNVAALSFEFGQHGAGSELLHAIEAAVDNAARSAARLAVFPEYLSTSLEQESDYPTWLTDQLVPLFKSLAVKHQMWLVGGTHLLPVTLHSAEHLNQAIIFSPEGQWFLQPKIHLVPSERVQTPKTVSGNEVIVFEVDGVRCAVLTCYDIEFPELCRRLVLEHKVELVLVPSWTSTEAGFWRVRYCALARATENQIFVVQAPLVGSLTRFQKTENAFGRAGIFTPCDVGFPENGVLAEGQNNVTDVVVAKLHFSRLRHLVSSGQVSTRVDAARNLASFLKISSFNF